MSHLARRAHAALLSFERVDSSSLSLSQPSLPSTQHSNTSMAPARTTNKENRAFALASDASDVSDAEAAPKQRRVAASKARVVIEEDTPKAAKSSSSARVKMPSSAADERERALEERLEKVSRLLGSIHRGKGADTPYHRAAQMTAERDAIQSEFDSLRELRKTEPERALSEVRRAAEAKSRRECLLCSVSSEGSAC